MKVENLDYFKIEIKNLFPLNVDLFVQEFVYNFI